jgi:tetratricopeptide (TPR) repeat protein
MRSVAIAVIAAAVLAAPAARAGEPEPPQPIPPKARKLVDTGRAAHGKGEYARAVALFKEAYVIAPSPGLLFNLAQAYRLMGNCDDAALMYHRYLDASLTQEGRSLAEMHLATVERCMAKRSLHIPMDESTAYLRAAPPPDPMLALDTQPLAARGSHARLEQRVGTGMMIAGGLTLSVAAYYGLVAHDASLEVEGAYAHGARGKDIVPIQARGEEAAGRATWLGITGGIATVTGVTLYIFGKRAERALPVTIAPANQGVSVSSTWRF